MKAKVTEELKQHFRPEFLNRVDEIVVFHQHDKDAIVKIVDLMVAQVEERLKDKDMGIELTAAAKELVAKRGFDPVLGARPLRRALQRDVEDILAEKILFGELRPGQIVRGRRRPRRHGRRGRRDRVLHLHRQPEVVDSGPGADRPRRRRWLGPAGLVVDSNKTAGLARSRGACCFS